MALTLTDLAVARMRPWLRCGWCGRQVVLQAYDLARDHGNWPLEVSLHRMRCGHCRRQAVKMQMITGQAKPGDARRHWPVFDLDGPINAIDCCPCDARCSWPISAISTA